MSSRDQLLPPWIPAAVLAGTFLTLSGLELLRALRRTREPKLRHLARNLTIAGIGAAAMALAEMPAVLPLARQGEQSGFGLVRLLPLHPAARSILAVLLLDYTLYLWHMLTHKVPFLWRFHLAHHIDLDCDASTALRFHLGELLLSVPFRAAQVILLGVAVREYSIWQTLVFACILFHHSNVDLSAAWDRRVSWLLVTPRMHGIHHDAILEHANSNWSSGLTLWDRLHGTLRLDVPQPSVVIGVTAYQQPADVTLARTMLVPLDPRPDAWSPARDFLPRPELRGRQ